ncbi:hypothetical protein MTR67_019199 [Solanum verrucosum]|uniref:Exosome complex component CSL4 n=1 Tax=Solanum verrucosum TaxID=315347 RepID=A0AAF0QL28_SOLVR|nr:hypothetical protein MTR67_019199 [Solanum verrucosum]
MTMAMEADTQELVTPGQVLGKASQLKAGKGAYVSTENGTVYASLTGFRSLIPPPSDSVDQRSTVEVTGHKAHGAVPQPGSIVFARRFYQKPSSTPTKVGARSAYISPSLDPTCEIEITLDCKMSGSLNIIVELVTKVMARTASADIVCVDSKSVREKFTGIIRQQDVRATEIDKVDMHLSFRPGDIIRALVLSLGDARAYYLSTAKNELGVVSAESAAGGTMVPISWTEMQCPLTGQVEPRKVAKVEA